MEAREVMPVVTTTAPALTAQEVYGQVQRIQQIIDMVMIEGVHYGVIPGTDEKSLWKPGAEKIVLAFHLVPRVASLEDLSADGEIFYRFKIAISGPLGNLLGEGVGECSSFEEKFAWREAICQEEWEATDTGLRRIKYKKGGERGFFTVYQIRTNPADQRNAVLKRAKKRSLVDAVLTVTAASDCFKQELEEDEEPGREQKKPDAPKQQAKAGAMLDGTFLSATPGSKEPKRPGKATIQHGTSKLDLGFWETPADLVKEPDWSKFKDRACRFSFTRSESKGRTYQNLTYLTFPAPAEEKQPEMFGGDKVAEEERAAMQAGA